MTNRQCLLTPTLGMCCMLLVGCAQHPRQPEMMRVCDSSGCFNRPANYASFDPNTAVPSDDPDGRIAALEQLAKNDPRAAFDLGLRFFRGDGVPQDSYRALKWMRDAAERGDLEAQKAVGRLYLTGLEEMGSDSREAQKWLSIAASRGDREAAELLKEAEERRQSDEEYSRWQGRWRPVFYNNWYSGYPYYWRWGQGGWYPY
ncbi:MAG: tetratricopeptide repeat protein [Gammaproteobacteria bacterium]